MSSNNGSKPIPFTPAREIPIVGQPFSLEGWLFQIVLLCKCEGGPKPVLIIGQAGGMGQCTSCRKVYILQSFTVNAQGQPQFNLAFGHGAPPAPGTGA